MAAKNTGKPWTVGDVQGLRSEASGNTPTRVLALHLQRTPAAVQAKASREHVSLAPTNQAPCGTAGSQKPRS